MVGQFTRCYVSGCAPGGCALSCPSFAPEWRNWYTHQTQNLASVKDMSVRVRPPAPPSSLFESLFARRIPLCRHVDNQFELVSNFPVNKNLINNGHARDAFFLQAHIAHGHRSLSVYLNGRVFRVDSVAVLWRRPIRFSKPVTRFISDKVIERALKGRSEVVRKLCQRWAEKYPSSVTKVIV